MINLKKMIEDLGKYFYIFINPFGSVLWVVVAISILANYVATVPKLATIILVIGTWIGKAYFNYRELQGLKK